MSADNKETNPVPLFVTEYRIGTDEDVKNHKAVYVIYRGNNKYVVSDHASVLSITGDWEWEPSPSNRDDEFITRTRFDLADAMKLAEGVYHENCSK